MSATAELGLAPGARVGEYEVLDVLGKGGMGTVYAGVHPLIGKKVAIKVLNPEMAQNPDVIARFVQEARSVNQIGHKNIIDIFAFGDLSNGAGHYFVMERLEGESLHARLAREGRLPAAATIAILEQVADAIDRAHAAGIFHRDLKPDNVFLVPDRNGPHVKVLDFGIAKLTEGALAAHTRTGVPMGTPMFMSPEQWKGREVDHRTDVYALGVMAFVMLTGSHPFEADSFPNLMYLHLQEPPPVPSQRGAPRWTDEPILAALAKDKTARPASAGEFVAALRRAMEAAPASFENTIPASSMPIASPTPVAASPTPMAVIPSTGAMLESRPGDYFAAPGQTLPPRAPLQRRIWPIVGAVIAMVAVGGFFALRSGDSPAVVPAETPVVSSGAPVPKPPDPAIEAKLTAVRAAVTKEDWALALALANQALALAPEHPDATALASKANDELRAHSQYERFDEQVMVRQVEAAARSFRAIPESSIYRQRAAQKLIALARSWLDEQVAAANTAATRKRCADIAAARARVVESFPDRSDVIATIDGHAQRCGGAPVRPKEQARSRTETRTETVQPTTRQDPPPPPTDPDKVKF